MPQYNKLPDISSLPKIDDYPNSGMLALNPQGTVSLTQPPEAFPDSLQGLLEGIQNKNLNFGMPSILDLEKSTPKNELLAGLQQGKNYGLPSIDDLQRKNTMLNNLNMGFAPDNTGNSINDFTAEPTPLLNGITQPSQFPQNNSLPTIDQFNSGLQPLTPTQNSNAGFMEHPFKNSFNALLKGVNSPLGRSLIMGGIVAGTGGSGLEALGYGAGVYGKNKLLTQQDATNKDFLQQQNIDTSGIKGYLSDDALKNYADNYSKFETLNTRKAALKLRQDLATAKDSTARAKLIFDAVKNNTLTPESAKAYADMLGISMGDLQASNQTNLTNANVDYITGAKTDNTNASTGYLNSRTTGQNITNEYLPDTLQAGINNKNSSTNYNNIMANEQPKRTGIMQQNTDLNQQRFTQNVLNQDRNFNLAMSRYKDVKDQKAFKDMAHQDLGMYLKIKQQPTGWGTKPMTDSKGKPYSVEEVRQNYISQYGIDPEKLIRQEN